GIVTNRQLTGAMRQGEGMHFVGVDLAWGEINQTGVAVVDADGRLLTIGTAQTDANIADALAPYIEEECLVAIDAPLIVRNATGHRPCETALNRDYQKFDAGAHPANMGKREFAQTPRAARLADALGLDEATPRLRVNHYAAWVELRNRVAAATRQVQLDSAEDPVDAVLCAYIALYAHRRPEDVTLYGDFDTGYIVTPTLPSHLAPMPRPRPIAESSRESGDLAQRLARAEATLAALQDELAWIRTQLG